MDNLYQELILDHYKYPRNYKKLSKRTHYATDNIISCGDELSFELFIEEGIIKNIGFQGKGCVICVASASILTEKIKRKNIESLRRLTKDDILKMLGIRPSPTRLKCALLSLEVLLKAINEVNKEF